MGCGTVIAFVALDLADLNHLGGAFRASISIVKEKNEGMVTPLTLECVSLRRSVYRMSGEAGLDYQGRELMILKFAIGSQPCSYRVTKRGVATLSSHLGT